MYPSQPATRFFDAAHCPDCRTWLPVRPAAGELHCPGCGLPLSGADAERLASLLTEADRTLAVLRLWRRPPAATMPAGFGPPAASGFSRPTGPGHPRRAPVRRELPALSGAAVLLGLGGLCLVISAIVFVSVSWQSLSLPAKVAVLAGVTALLAGAATATTGRRLRRSAETLWAITFANLGLDLWAARRADLLGLHSTSAGGYTAAAATLVGVLALGCCLATGRSRLGPQPLVAPQTALGLTGVLAVLAGTFTLVRADWAALGVAAALLVALAVAARAERLPITGWSLAAGSLLPWLGLLATGLVQVASHRLVPQLWHGRAFELPIAAALALGVAAIPAVLRRNRPRAVAAGIGLAAAGVLITAVANHYLLLPLALVTTTVVLALVSLQRHPVWRPAVAGVLGLGLLLDGLVLVSGAFPGAGESIRPADWLWRGAAGHRLAGLAGGSALPASVLLAVAAAVFIARRDLLRAPDDTLPWTLSIGTMLAAGLTLGARPTVLVATLIWLGAALVTLAVAARYRRPGLLIVPAVAEVSALACAPAADLSSLIGFAATAVLVLVTGRWLLDPDAESRLSAELAAVGLAAMAVAAGWHRVQPAGAAPAQAGLLAAATALGIVAMLSARRRWWGWLMLACLTVVSWIEAAEHQVHAPEAYTVPAGLLMLGLGWWVARRESQTSSWLTLGPGLAVLTAPTLMLALREPLSWRALAVALLALAVTLAAAQHRLQAPTLIGAAELAVLAVRELGPYALALPRWAVIGAVGLLLLVVGVSWEDRLADLRHTKRRLAAMR